MRLTVISTLVVLACGGEVSVSPCAAGEDCRIEFVHVARVGADDVPGALVHDGPVMSRLTDGRFIIFDPRDRVGLKLYDANGEFVRIIGRPGGGPGEYSLPWHHQLTPDGDTLRIIEGLSRRMTMLTANGESVIETRPFGVSPARHLLFLDDGRYVVNGIVVEADGLGYPLHIVSASGERVRSFGAENPIYLNSQEAELGRRLARGPDGTIWAVQRMSYVVEQWDTLGNLLRTIRPSSTWFPDPNKPYMPLSVNDDPPSHRVNGLWYMDGILWLATQVPSPDWRDRLEPIDAPPGARQYRLRSPQVNLWMTRVEAVDPVTGEVIATADHPDGVYDMLSEGHFYTISLNEWDVPFAEVWHLQLTTH
jgi:hypothetical protein